MNSDWQPAAGDQELWTKLPHGYNLLDTAYGAIFDGVYSWNKFSKLIETPNWHYTPSVFVDERFFSRPQGARKTKAQLLLDGDARLQPYARKEDREVRQGMCNFIFRCLVHENKDKLRVWRYDLAPGEQLSPLPTSYEETINEDESALRDFIQAGPALLTQAYAKHILLEMRAPGPLHTFMEGRKLILPKKLVPNDQEIHARLDSFSGLISPLIKGRALALAKECIRFSRQYAMGSLNRDHLARHLGVNPNTTVFRKVWSDFLILLPDNERVSYSRPGRPTSRQGKY